MSSRLLITLAGAFTLWHSAVYSQSIGFVQFEAPGQAIQGPGTNVLDAAGLIENSYGLDWAVLESNRLELQHRLDFVVVTLDFAVFKPNPEAAAQEIATKLRGLNTNRVFLLAGPCLQTPEVRIRYGKFVAEVKKELPPPLHTIVDLTGSSQAVGDFTVIGLDSALLGLEGSRAKEISRVESALHAAQVALILGSIESIPAGGKIEAKSLWKLPDWKRVTKNPKISGIFLSVLGKTPQIGPLFPSPKNRPGDSGHPSLFIAPRTSAKIEAPGRGLLFARAARDGQIIADPIWMRSAFEGDAQDLRSDVTQAELKEQNGEYLDAHNLYSSALKSKDAHVRTLAEAGLRRTDQALGSRWEILKAKSIAAGWLAAHWRDVLIAVIISALFALWRRYRTFHNYVIGIPDKLSADAPVELFLFEFLDTAKMIRQTWKDVPMGLEAKNTKVAFSTMLGRDIASRLDSLKLAGVDVQAIVKWILVLWRYFSWKLELSVYGTPGQVIVYARLCWAWHTRREWIQPTSITGPMNVSVAASALAYDVMGVGVIRS